MSERGGGGSPASAAKSTKSTFHSQTQHPHGCGCWPRQHPQNPSIRPLARTRTLAGQLIDIRELLYRDPAPSVFSTFPSGATAWCAGPLSNLSPARSASSCRASRLFLAPRPPLRSPSQPSPTAFPTCLVPLGPPSSSISTSPSYDRSTIWSRVVVPPSLLNPAPGPTPLTPCPLPTLTP